MCWVKHMQWTLYGSACLSVCISLNMCVVRSLYTRSCVYVCKQHVVHCIWIHVVCVIVPYMFGYTNIGISMHGCESINRDHSMYIHIHVYIYIYVYIYLYIYIYLYLYIYIYIYIYIERLHKYKWTHHIYVMGVMWIDIRNAYTTHIATFHTHNVACIMCSSSYIPASLQLEYISHVASVAICPRSLVDSPQEPVAVRRSMADQGGARRARLCWNRTGAVPHY